MQKCKIGGSSENNKNTEKAVIWENFDLTLCKDKKSCADQPPVQSWQSCEAEKQMKSWSDANQEVLTQNLESARGDPQLVWVWITQQRNSRHFPLQRDIKRILNGAVKDQTSWKSLKNYGLRNKQQLWKQKFYGKMEKKAFLLSVWSEPLCRNVHFLLVFLWYKLLTFSVLLNSTNRTPVNIG